MNIVKSLFFFLSSFALAVSPAVTYTEGVSGQPKSFLPHQAETQTDKTISHLIYRGLFKYDIYGTLHPDLADTWEISNEGTVYTIKLKDGQFWSDNHKITSNDLIYTAFKIPSLSTVSSDKVDDLTVRFTLPNKFSPFLSLMTIGIMQANSEENYNPLTPVTSGQFKVVRIERSGPEVKSVTLYNNDVEARIKKLVFKYYPNEEEIHTAAMLGEVDGFISANSFELENVKEYKYPVQSVYYALFINTTNENLKDAATRQKFEKVLPIKDIVFHDGITVEGAISRSIYTDKDLVLDKFDDKFSDDLKGIKVRITVPDIEAQINIAEKVKNYWEDKLNVSVDIIKKNPEELQEVIAKRDFEVLLYGQEVGRDPDRYIYWHSTQKEAPGLNITQFEQVRADRALEEGRKETDESKRMVHYNEFQKVIEAEVPAIFLYHPYAKYYVNKYIEGVGEKYTFTIGDRFLDFNNWNRVDTN